MSSSRQTLSRLPERVEMGDAEFLAHAEELARTGGSFWGYEVDHLKKLADWADTVAPVPNPMWFVRPDPRTVMKAVEAARKRLGVVEGEVKP